MAEYQTSTWEDRDSDYPSNRKLTVLTTESSTLSAGVNITAQVQRFEGEIHARGTPFNATTMNGLESRIQSAFSKCSEIINFGTIDNTQIDSNDGFNLSRDALDCPILEFLYSDSGDQYGRMQDGMESSKIFISDYSSPNKISLDQISCGQGDNNDFYIKTVTLGIIRNGDYVNIKKEHGRSKRLVFNGNWDVQQSSQVDIKIYNILGYKFSIT